MGHEDGDLLIQAVGRKLTETLRKTDTIARFGGDEFLILINNVEDAENISKVADKVMDIFQNPFMVRDQEIFITASAGISVFPADGEDAQTLIKHADIAMYTAKEKGKNQYAFCSSNMKQLVEYRVNLSNNLYHALDRSELKVYYQPQIDLATEQIVGMEALLRWFQPESGMIPPMEFIPLAEQTGLINSIGAWVLESACLQAARWEAANLGALRVAVNLSVVQLRNPGLVEQVADILKRTGVNPAQVELEITESTTMREPDYIIRVLSELKALGVTISIDDFGIEYSSLNRLKMLPVDKLKMDIQFVRGIDKSPKDQAITVVIMNLAKNLNLKLVAEGVESLTQLNFLRNRMCDEVQGFYYFRPMPPEEIEKILRR
jgi:predicted signal transduction protein with EAL and GGDEF domain